MKFAGAGPVLVKLQRPPPDIRIFLPTRLACSTTSTRWPRRPAVSAHISPAAPPPMTSASNVSATRSGPFDGGHAQRLLHGDAGAFAVQLGLAVLDHALQ